MGARYPLTEGRRKRVCEILSRLGEGVSVQVKARAIVREWPVQIELRDAMSLLNQFRKPQRKKRRKTAAEINQERFERMRAGRPDLY